MEILTPFQKELLRVIGNSNLADNFYLTGGTALAAFYLQHRYSEDLDFFTADPNAVRLVAPSLETVAQTLSAALEFNSSWAINYPIITRLSNCEVPHADQSLRGLPP